MNVLFIHQNFPGQFKHLAPAMARRGHNVVAMTMRKEQPAAWQGVRLVPYVGARASTQGMHPWLIDFEAKTIRGEACFRAALQLKAEGFTPDVIVAHPGWGESLFVKQAWPHARMGIYCEFYYKDAGADVGFDPEFPNADPDADACRLRLKNLNNLLHFETADAGLSPTRWQASTFPEPFAGRIAVFHDGIDTQVVKPRADVGIQLAPGRVLTRQDEVITFVNRNLEPYRGYHVFMRALPELLRRRPHAQVLIVGGDEVSYGAPPSPAKYGFKTWKDVFAHEVRPRIPDADWARVRFIGKLPYPQFVGLLQLSRVHVYLTYPFVLSWSLLEAMSVGGAIVASDTAPVREVIRHDETGRLVDFFDGAALVDQVDRLLDDAPARERLGRNARAQVQAEYDLHSVCLPGQVAWVESLAR